MLYQRPFGIYEKALKPAAWKQMFSDAAKAGYDYFELSLDESKERLKRLEWETDQIQEVRKAADMSGIKLFSACFSGHRRYPLGSSDAETEKKSVVMLNQAIELCAKLDIRVLQIAGYDVFYEPHSEDTARRYVSNLSKGLYRAEQLGVMLAIEPVEVFLTSVENTLNVVKEINSPWLHIYPDIANMASLDIDPVEQLGMGGGHTIALHIRDALPDYFYGVELGKGIIDFEAVFAKLDEIGYAGPLTIEMWNLENPDYLQIITDARQFMLDKINIARNCSC